MAHIHSNGVSYIYPLMRFVIGFRRPTRRFLTYCHYSHQVLNCSLSFTATSLAFCLSGPLKGAQQGSPSPSLQSPHLSIPVHQKHFNSFSIPEDERFLTTLSPSLLPHWRFVSQALSKELGRVCPSPFLLSPYLSIPIHQKHLILSISLF